MIYCFDIDGVLCETEGTDYFHAKPIHAAIKKVQILAEQGHTIIIYTGRGSLVQQNGIRSLTRGQLKTWSVPYKSLYFGKPAADVYVDDKAKNVADWMREKS